MSRIHAEDKKNLSFSLPDLKGTTHTLDQYRGKVVVIDLWAMWCTSCYKVFPVLNELREKFPADKLAVIGISIDQKKSSLVQSFVKKAGITYTVLHDQSQKTPETFGISGLPSLFVIDPDGKVVFSSDGFKGEEEKLALTAMVEKLAGNIPAPEKNK